MAAKHNAIPIRNVPDECGVVCMVEEFIESGVGDSRAHQSLSGKDEAAGRNHQKFIGRKPCFFFHEFPASNNQ